MNKPATQKTHELKTHPEAFQAVEYGVKMAEFRKNDRDFAVGDILILRDYDPKTEQYSGKFIKRLVTHIQTGYGIPDGYVMLSMSTIRYSPFL
ncbi:ASCH/PUA domain-containing protein [Chroococcidiopsis sp.]|uniref:ASCH/PUA domain-containing protein n=1 Tax=Chroococcidiopsis sp. TaxID=3088168 RepID=UPI003F414FEC